MDMEESPEEFTASNDHHGRILIKGKRTKRRQRPSSPISVPAITTSSSSSGGADCGDKFSVPSPMVSGDDTTYESTTEEEEDMANCLILLAQSGRGGCGGGKRRNEGCGGKGSEKLNTRKFTDPAAAAAGLYGYECKTCNRTFSSFQALGGHRASHKRPKTAMTTEDKKSLETPPPSEYDRFYDKIAISPNFTLLHGTDHHNKLSSSKVHECSICGTEFSSGQALGGHMRRHRTLTNAQINTTDHHQTHEPERRSNILSLDLNLPAPDDDRDTKFQFTTPPNQSPFVFSSPALVDCHY